MQIKEYLNREHIDYQIWSHQPTFTAQQMAAEEHTPGMNVAKPVIVRGDERYYMCVLPACCRVDLEALRGQLGASEVHLATEEEMTQLFPDCEIGAEPPFGNLFGLPTLLDESLVPDDYIVCQAGKHDQAVRLSMKDYRQLVNPRVLTFGYHLH